MKHICDFQIKMSQEDCYSIAQTPMWPIDFFQFLLGTVEDSGFEKLIKSHSYAGIYTEHPMHPGNSFRISNTLIFSFLSKQLTLTERENCV